MPPKPGADVACAKTRPSMQPVGMPVLADPAARCLPRARAPCRCTRTCDLSATTPQALLRAVKTELEAEGGVLRTTDEYVDALINYKIRRLVRKHALAASALAGTGASGAALLGLLLQALARLSRAGPGRTTTSAPPDRPPLKARPPGASDILNLLISQSLWVWISN